MENSMGKGYSERRISPEKDSGKMVNG